MMSCRISLWNAIRLAHAMGKRQTVLSDVIAALCLDDELVIRLTNKYDFKPLKYMDAFARGRL